VNASASKWLGPQIRAFAALMHREYEHDEVRVTDLWLFGLTTRACRLTATPRVGQQERLTGA